MHSYCAGIFFFTFETVLKKSIEIWKAEHSEEKSTVRKYEAESRESR